MRFVRDCSRPVARDAGRSVGEPRWQVTQMLGPFLEREERSSARGAGGARALV